METKLPPQLLGWEVGTFEIASDRITIKGYKHHHMKLKMRTGGAAVSARRTSCQEGEGAFFDLSDERLKQRLRLPIKHRYRSAIIFQLKEGGKAYAVLWLHHLIDNEETTIDLPIWTTKNVLRLTQNYITEDNLEEKRQPGLEDVKEVGRIQFTCRFSPGLDETHESLVHDNTSRETYETWEECVSEGVRDRRVSMELPENVQQLHRKSLIQERDVLRQATPEDREKMLEENTGIDWAKIFGGADEAFHPGKPLLGDGPLAPPRQSTDGGSQRRLSGGSSSGSEISFHQDQAKSQAPSQMQNQDQNQTLSQHHVESELQNQNQHHTGDQTSTQPQAGSGLHKDGTATNAEHHPVTQGALTNAHSHATKGPHRSEPRSADQEYNDQTQNRNENPYDDTSSEDSDEDGSSLVTTEGGQEHETIEDHQQHLGRRMNKRSEHRKQRGMMQWKPARNAEFVKNEARFALQKVKKKFTGDLSGREPDIETETG